MAILLRILATVHVNTDGQCFSNLTTDGLYPNARGGIRIMKAIEAKLTPRYAVHTFTVSANNKFTYTVFSGTSGSLNGVAKGQLATGRTLTGTAPVGTSYRTVSKDVGQVLSFNFPSGGTDSAHIRCMQRYTAVQTGKTAYYEVETRILNTGVGAGVWRSLNAELRTSVGSLSIGFDRAGTTDEMTMDELPAFLAAKGRTLLLRSPAMTIPASTYIEGRHSTEANTIGGALAGSVELLNEQLVVV